MVDIGQSLSGICKVKILNGGHIQMLQLISKLYLQCIFNRTDKTAIVLNKVLLLFLIYVNM